MKRIFLSALFAAAALAGVGCGNSTNPPPVATNALSAAEVEHPIPTKAQPKLQTLKLWVGSKEILAELALTGLQQQAGMMFRTNVTDEEGMLFVSAYPEKKGYWMKNTSLPLSLAYIDPDGAILEVHDLHPFDTNVVESISENVQYVLETPQGWFQRHNVPIGTVVSSELGTFKKLFAPRQ